LVKNFICIAISVLALGATVVAARQDSRLRDEESLSYYRKWLDEDVTYIITEEERAVFNKLSTPEEKEQFIEQFWFRRDPDPRTAGNEFKEEHYRRIAYANEHFHSGLPGWMTDRGRIYIIHGPPDEIESHASGGNYNRKAYEGGGSTSTYPFEVWRYRHIEGVGDDVELEFVDPSLTGEYRLALNPEEKDALLYVPGGGATMAEELGLATKADRPWFSPGNREHYPLMPLRAKDNPFTRYETYSLVQRPAKIKYQDLKEIVKVNLAYDSLPFVSREDYFQLSKSELLVPITFQIRNRDLSFAREHSGQVARVAVYGIITSITNRVVTEFEDDLVVSYPEDRLQEGLLRDSAYQKIVLLDPRLRYKLDLVIKDKNSQKVGVVRKALRPPKFEEDHLVASRLILADEVRLLEGIPKQDEMFVLGDVKVRPSLRARFASDKPLGFYCQLYNVALDQTSMTPSLEVSYRLLQDGSVVREALDDQGSSVQYFSTDRVVLVGRLKLEGLDPGKYQVQVSVKDKLSDQSVDLNENLEIVR
jgi:GWxTD domain-containing protein